MTRNAAENGPSNAGSRAGPNSEQALDAMARLNAQLLPQQSPMQACDMHSYPCPPQRLHSPKGTGGNGGGHLHDNY